MSKFLPPTTQRVPRPLTRDEKARLAAQNWKLDGQHITPDDFAAQLDNLAGRHARSKDRKSEATASKARNNGWQR